MTSMSVLFYFSHFSFLATIQLCVQKSFAINANLMPKFLKIPFLRRPDLHVREMKNFLRGHIWSLHTISGLPILSCFTVLMVKHKKIPQTAPRFRVTDLCLTVSPLLFWFIH